MPQLYPFIVNDPGEGTQAKRRIGAVIVDHLTPPLTRAESYGPLQAISKRWSTNIISPPAWTPGGSSTCGPRSSISRAPRGSMPMQAWSVMADDALAALDNYLCDLKEMQIRDGLHVFTQSPEGRLRTDLLVALARTPRGYDVPGQASLLRSIADDLGLAFDPLDCRLGDRWAQARPEILAAVSDEPWRTIGDTVERLELLASDLVSAPERIDPPGPKSAAVLATIGDDLSRRVDACGTAERTALLAGLDGRFVAPGPSGAPTRGRPDVLPTGRNFYSVDTRSVPTATAWDLGQRSAELLVQDYFQREGNYPTAMALSAWGTANMRTGGDDIAQALALMGVKPRWEWTSGRVVGFEMITIAELRRPRVDVTLRVSGFFRDAFPEQIDLVDSAARAVMALDEAPGDNPAAARARAEADALVAAGEDPKSAARRAGARVFGSKPGAYGAGLQAMIDEKLWHDRARSRRRLSDLGQLCLWRRCRRRCRTRAVLRAFGPGRCGGAEPG